MSYDDVTVSQTRMIKAQLRLEVPSEDLRNRFPLQQAIARSHLAVEIRVSTPRVRMIFKAANKNNLVTYRLVAISWSTTFYNASLNDTAGTA